MNEKELHPSDDPDYFEEEFEEFVANGSYEDEAEYNVSRFLMRD